MTQLLTRLNPKVQSYTDTGGKVELSPSDIAAACSGANPLGLSIALAKICGDRSEQTKAFYPILRGVAQIAIEQGWKIKRGEERLRSLTQLAVFEATNGEACPRCKGTTFNPRDPTKACTPCRGSGKYTISTRDRAQALGISEVAWNKTWLRRYEDVKVFIDTCEYKALKKIRKRLK